MDERKSTGSRRAQQDPNEPPDRGDPPIGDDRDDVDREEDDLVRRMVTADQLALDPEPRRTWIVEDHIPDENLTLITGKGGIGKTKLMLQLAVAMQIKGDWLGMQPTQGPVLFVTSEEDRKDVNISLRAILKAEGKSLAHCPDLRIIPLADRDSCLATAPNKLAALTATPLWIAIERLAERHKPKLLILDALADLFGGEENVRRHVRGFIVLLKHLAMRLKLAVALIAHPSLSGMNSGSGLSGSTDWHNGPRARLYFHQPEDDRKPTDPDSRILTVMKAQYSGAEGTEYRLRYKAGVYVYEGKSGGNTPYDRAAATAKADAVFLRLLQAFEDQGRRVSPNTGPTYAPSVFAADDDCENVSSKALARAMGRLLKANRIHVEKTGSPSRRREKLTPGPPPSTPVKEAAE